MEDEIYGNKFIQISETNQKTLIGEIATEERAHTDLIIPHYLKLMIELIL